jgi:MFS family permease
MPPIRRLLPLLLVAQLMVILDITAVNIAMPELARDLHIAGSAISWTITAYSLVFGSLLLLGGRAADRTPGGERLRAGRAVEAAGDDRKGGGGEQRGTEPLAGAGGEQRRRGAGHRRSKR